MKSFIDFIINGKRKSVSLYHGSKEPRQSLRLPEKYDKKSNDGHAVYLSTHPEEAKTYGEHLHHTELNYHPHELMNLDISPIKSGRSTRSSLIRLAKKHKISLHGKGEYSFEPIATNLDVVHRLGKKIGYENATKEFVNHGIIGGYGESIIGKKPNIKKTRVYSIYDTSRLKVNKIDSD